MFVGISYVRRDERNGVECMIASDMFRKGMPCEGVFRKARLLETCSQSMPIRIMRLENMRIAMALKRGEPAPVPL